MARMLADAAAREQARRATHELAGSMFEAAGLHDRAASVRRGEGMLLDVSREAIAALDAERRAKYAEAVRLVAEATARRPS